MPKHSSLIQLSALRSQRVSQAQASVPRLWPAPPVPVQIQLAKRMAKLPRRMTPQRPVPIREGSRADRGEDE